MDALEHNYGSSFAFVYFASPHMQREVVVGQLGILTIPELCYFFES